MDTLCIRTAVCAGLGVDARVHGPLGSAHPPGSGGVRFGWTACTVGRGGCRGVRGVRQSSGLGAWVEYRELEKFSGFLCSAGGSRGRLGPGVVCFLLSILMGLSALIYVLINALKKLTHCVNALKKLTP